MSLPHLATAALLVGAVLPASALETFQGYDPGLGNAQRLPAHPASDAAHDAFMATLMPGVAAQTFESVAVTPPVYEVRTLTLAFGQQTAVLHGSGLVMDSPAGTANPINGVPSGVYPTSGTRAWLSADDFELRFDAPQVALGFYGVDIGDFNGQLTLELVHEDLSTTLVFASSGVLDLGGSVQFFGLLSVDRPFVTVRFGNSAPVGYDGFVFDDLVVADATQLAPVPEPGTWAMLALGLGALMTRRHAQPG